MGRFIVVFVLQITINALLLSGPVFASDGDVDYSTPYITVDPQTGQLVTKNPGPKLKSHPMDMSAPAETTTPDTVAVTASTSVSAKNENQAVVSPEQGEKQTLGTMPMITVIVTGLLVFGAVMVRRFRQSQ